MRFGFSDDIKRQVYGFTDITLMCRCGALKIHRLIGKHGQNAADREVEALRKMAGLK